ASPLWVAFLPKFNGLHAVRRLKTAARRIGCVFARESCSNDRMEPVRNPPSGECMRFMARGFTAVELLVVIAIVAILLALALPSFQPIIDRWRVRQAVEGMQSVMYYARSEAIKRGGNVVAEKLSTDVNDNSCAAPDDWSCGWIVCTSTNNNCGTDSVTLQRFDPIGVDVKGLGGSANADIQFNRWGLAAQAQWLGFTVSPKDKGMTDPATRGLCMSSAGRMRIIPMESVPCSDTNN
ncbi:MAG: GspH/FimT family pseudopilin, partial [Desulfovibrionaceae bacterium]|nr:GspH/FimT family pseudopilin [Desulfovibrionaceae bacterium]